MVGVLVLPAAVLLVLFLLCHVVLSGGDASSRVSTDVEPRFAVRSAVGQMANRRSVDDD
jgi:hypothetical protein